MLVTDVFSVPKITDLHILRYTKYSLRELNKKLVKIKYPEIVYNFFPTFSLSPVEGHVSNASS